MCIVFHERGRGLGRDEKRERERESGPSNAPFSPNVLTRANSDGWWAVTRRTRLRRTGGGIRTSANELVRRLDRGVRVGLVCQTTPQNVCNKGRCIVTGMTPLEKSANNAPHKRRVKTGKRQKPRVDLLPSARQLELIGQHESHRGRPRLVDSARDN